MITLTREEAQKLLDGFDRVGWARTEHSDILRARLAHLNWSKHVQKRCAKQGLRAVQKDGAKRMNRSRWRGSIAAHCSTTRKKCLLGMNGVTSVIRHLNHSTTPHHSANECNFRRCYARCGAAPKCKRG